MSDDRIILAGCGNMGFALLSGWIASGAAKPHNVVVVEPNEDLAARAATLGVTVTTAAEAGDAHLVVLAVKPQIISAVAEAYRGQAERGSTFLSIAAGVPIAALEEVLGSAIPIIRCMPNLPASIGEGVMAICANRQVTDEMMAFATDLLDTNGMVEPVDDEDLMHAVTAVSGSGPAYLFHFIECLAVAGEKAGLPADTAAKLAMQTVYGAASLAQRSVSAPALLREQVTSPNGTTAEALDVLMVEGRMQRMIEEAVEAALARSVSLGG